MPVPRLPVCPDLDQLKHQARDLLRAINAGDPTAIAELREYHPGPIPLADINNTRKIAGVVLNGRYLGRETLDRLVAEAELSASR